MKDFQVPQIEQGQGKIQAVLDFRATASASDDGKIDPQILLYSLNRMSSFTHKV